MIINIAQINNYIRQLNEQSAVLRRAQSSLISYLGNLNTHWKGAEMATTNRVMNDHINRIASIAADLDSIGRDIAREAEAIKVAEELAVAQAQNQSGQSDKQ